MANHASILAQLSDSNQEPTNSVKVKKLAPVALKY